jgi:hypothetical protein
VARLYKCPDCGATVESGDLVYPIPDVEEKVLPGEPMPVGECRECGALVPAEPVETDDRLNEEED